MLSKSPQLTKILGTLNRHPEPTVNPSETTTNVCLYQDNAVLDSIEHGNIRKGGFDNSKVTGTDGR